ncbi:MAG: hypothetical protein ABIG61_13745 [Planctomycetota bacterium]
MSNLNIKLRDDRTAFKPCEEIQGQVEWQLDSNSDFLELSLFWRTEGKGTKDTGIVETLRFDNPGSFGNSDFRVKLPNGPYSFSGKLISIIWNVELAVSKGKDAVQRRIIISPTEQEIICTDLISDSNDDEPKNILQSLIKKFKFGSSRF